MPHFSFVFSLVFFNSLSSELLILYGLGFHSIILPELQQNTYNYLHVHKSKFNQVPFKHMEHNIYIPGNYNSSWQKVGI